MKGSQNHEFLINKFFKACFENKPESVEEILRIYLDPIRKVDEKIYVIENMLRAKRNDGFNSLAIACKNNNPDLVNQIFNLISTHVQKGDRRDKLIATILTAENKGGLNAIDFAYLNKKKDQQGLSEILSSNIESLVSSNSTKYHLNNFTKNTDNVKTKTDFLEAKILYFNNLITACTKGDRVSFETIFRKVENSLSNSNHDKKADFIKDILTAKNESGFNALGILCANNNKFLVDRIFNVISQNISQGKKRDELIKTMLTATTENGETALISAYKNENQELVSKLFTEVELLVSDDRKKAEIVETMLTTGFTALTYACSKNNPWLVNQIFGAVLNYVPRGEKRDELIKTMLTATTENGETALISAYKNENQELVSKLFIVVEFLVSDDRKKAEIIENMLTAQNKEGLNAVSIARDSGTVESLSKNIIQCLLPEGIPQSILDIVEPQKQSEETSQNKIDSNKINEVNPLEASPNIQRQNDKPSQSLDPIRKVDEKIDDIENMLRAKRNDGFNSLAIACKDNDPDLVNQIFNLISTHFQKGDRRDKLIETILTAENKEGLNAIDFAYLNKKKDQQGLYEILSSNIESLVSSNSNTKYNLKNKMDIDNVKRKTDFLGTKILYSNNLITACTKGDRVSFETIFREVETLFYNSNHDKKAHDKRADFIKDILTAKNESGFNALGILCANNKKFLVDKIFNVISKNISQGKKRDELIKTMLTATTENGETAIISACKNNNQELVSKLFTEVELLVSDDRKKAEIVETMVLARNKGGLNAISIAKNNDTFKVLEEGIKKCFSTKKIPQEESEIVEKQREETSQNNISGNNKVSEINVAQKSFPTIFSNIQQKNNKPSQLVERPQSPQTQDKELHPKFRASLS